MRRNGWQKRTAGLRESEQFYANGYWLYDVEGLKGSNANKKASNYVSTDKDAITQR